MHLAVGVANSNLGESFVQYVNDLDNAGLSPRDSRRSWTESGIEADIANHDLPALTEPDSVTTVAITEHLLQTIYELPNLSPSPSRLAVGSSSGCGPVARIAGTATSGGSGSLTRSSRSSGVGWCFSGKASAYAG